MMEEAVHPDQPSVDAKGGELRHHQPQGSRVQPFSASEVFATRVCSDETLASFSSTFPVWISSSLVSPKPFDDVPKLTCVQQLPCPDGKQALSTKAWLYQDLRVKWATLQMVEHYLTML